jgi:hypothetical protein
MGYQHPRALVATDCLLNTTVAAIRLLNTTLKSETAVAGLRGSKR